VHDAALSKGMGVYDFLPEMDTIKPDVYFVNEVPLLDTSNYFNRIASATLEILI
jgi:hypothetical protein